MYTFKIGIPAEVHDTFVKNHPLCNLLQSSSWAKVKDNWGSEIVGVYEKDTLVASSLVLIKPLPAGFTMLYTPRGPVMDYTNERLVSYFMAELKKFGKKKRALFIKMDPAVQRRSSMNIHYYLIINEQASSGNGRKVARKVIQQLKQQELKYTALYTDYAGHEKELTKELAETTLLPWSEDLDVSTFPILVVLGGDGTLHNVINSLLPYDSAIPLSYIPCGSGNDFARGVGLSRNIDKALHQILRTRRPKEIQTIHYVEANQEEIGLATNNVGLGLDAAIVEKTNESSSKKALNKFKLGSLSYISSIIHVFFKQKGFPILVEMNGKQYTFNRAFLCTVTNHPYFGGGVSIMPTANPRKAVVDLVVVERINIFKILWLIFLLLRQKQGKSKHFHHFQSSKIRIVSTIPQTIHADGEILGKRSIDMVYTTQKRLFWF